jgi:small subunit ribosomal protein S8
MITYRVADFVTRLRNASKVGKAEVVVPHTNQLAAIAAVLVTENYLKSQVVRKGVSGFPELVVELQYVGTLPAINHIKSISTPGARIYKKNHSIKSVLSGMGLFILSTSQGIMSNKTASKSKLGGEVLIELW